MNAVSPILLDNERVIKAFRESFSFFGDSILPKWTVLTNLKLIFLIREIPGISVYEFYLQGMTLELFQDSIGLYDNITFLLNGQVLYTLQVIKKRWPEAKLFAQEVQKSISQIEYELRSENQNTNDTADASPNPELDQKCNYEKRHLKDLANMGVITNEEYHEEVEKPCKK